MRDAVRAEEEKLADAGRSDVEEPQAHHGAAGKAEQRGRQGDHPVYRRKERIEQHRHGDVAHDRNDIAPDADGDRK